MRQLVLETIHSPIMQIKSDPQIILATNCVRNSIATPHANNNERYKNINVNNIDSPRTVTAKNLLRNNIEDNKPANKLFLNIFSYFYI